MNQIAAPKRLPRATMMNQPPAPKGRFGPCTDGSLMGRSPLAYAQELTRLIIGLASVRAAPYYCRNGANTDIVSTGAGNNCQPKALSTGFENTSLYRHRHYRMIRSRASWRAEGRRRGRSMR